MMRLRKYFCSCDSDITENENISSLAYADDLIILANSDVILQRILLKVVEKWINLLMNIPKSKPVIFELQNLSQNAVELFRVKY